MKYRAQSWGSKGAPNGLTITITHLEHKDLSNTLRESNELGENLVEFHCGRSPERRALCLSLANKLVAYLNERQEKIESVEALMSIASDRS